MIYYHVSRLIEEGQKLTKQTKNNYNCCEYISNYDVSSRDKLLSCYRNLHEIDIHGITGRNSQKWCCEALFEYIRRTEFPDRPSRIWGIYLSENFNDARSFLDIYRKPIIEPDGNQLVAHIYEIDVPNNKVVFIFDMKLYSEVDEYLQKMLIENAIDEDFYEFICDKIREYWNSVMTTNPIKEHLVECDIIVGKKIC